MNKYHWNRSDAPRSAGRRSPALMVLLLGMALLITQISISPPMVEGAYLNEIFGDYTSIAKPVPAVEIKSGEIPVGNVSTYGYTLKAGHRYHVYLTGDWANPKIHSTDYDIFVYKIKGVTAPLLSTHTEAAGLPEQVGNDGLGRYFIPKESGQYWFAVRNDAYESAASQAATLMVIENIDCNVWMSQKMEGKVNEQPQADTAWAYEFVSSSDRVKVHIDVPSTLDMYEVRLYIMAKPTASKGELLEGIPTAWPPGLLGTVSGVYGGFNLDPKGFRHVDAMASCEMSGEDMVIDYNVPVSGELLYHLVLMAEYGVGTVNYMIQTDFEPPEIDIFDPPEEVETYSLTRLVVNVDDETEIEEVSFSYSVNGGETWSSLDIEDESGGNYSVIVPPVERHEVVDYAFRAVDEMGNEVELTGSYVFIPQTDFEPPELNLVNPPETPEAWKPVNLKVQVIDVSLIRKVEFAYSTDDGESWIHQNVIGEEGGIYGVTVTGHRPGTLVDYNFTAEDDEGYTSTVEDSYRVVGKGSLSLSLRGVEIFGGEEILVLGQLNPPERNVSIRYFKGDMDESYTVTADETGYMNHSFRPSVAGIWHVKAAYEGEDNYLPAESDLLNFTVVSVTSTLSCQLSKTRVQFGNTATITGTFTPKKGEVTIEFALKTKDSITKKWAWTLEDGTYSLEFEPEAKGSLWIQGHVLGDGLVYTDATSEQVELTVVNPSLTTTLLRLPSTLTSILGPFLKPPYLYGILGLLGIAGGGIFLYIRQRYY